MSHFIFSTHQLVKLNLDISFNTYQSKSLSFLLVLAMVLLQYGLPLFISVCFWSEKVGWLADLKIRSGPSIECKNQILPVVAFNAEPDYERSMVLALMRLFDAIPAL